MHAISSQWASLLHHNTGESAVYFYLFCCIIFLNTSSCFFFLIYWSITVIAVRLNYFKHIAYIHACVCHHCLSYCQICVLQFWSSTYISGDHLIIMVTNYWSSPSVQQPWVIPCTPAVEALIPVSTVWDNTIAFFHWKHSKLSEVEYNRGVLQHWRSCECVFVNVIDISDNHLDMNVLYIHFHVTT